MMVEQIQNTIFSSPFANLAFLKNIIKYNFNIPNNLINNTFNPTTKIDYDLPKYGKVNLILYDIAGREAAVLVNEVKQAGYYTMQFNAGNLASGIYFYRIPAENFVEATLSKI
jgi:hypothetical protein